jgi:hypothetical protein
LSEPILEKLSRFTPDAGALNRDALLFAGGRASARPNRAWIALAAVLAATQVLTVVLWWSQPASTVAQLPLSANPAPSSSSPTDSPIPDSSDDPGLWSVRHNLLEAPPEDRVRTGKFAETEPPLHAFGASLPSTLN